MISPQFIIPAMMLGIITKCVMAYPSSFDKQVRSVPLSLCLPHGASLSVSPSRCLSLCVPLLEPSRRVDPHVLTPGLLGS
jgi:hypothetical protein